MLSGPEGIRTPGRPVKSRTLYLAKLQALFVFCNPGQINFNKCQGQLVEIAFFQMCSVNSYAPSGWIPSLASPSGIHPCACFDFIENQDYRNRSDSNPFAVGVYSLVPRLSLRPTAYGAILVGFTGMEISSGGSPSFPHSHCNLFFLSIEDRVVRSPFVAVSSTLPTFQPVLEQVQKRGQSSHRNSRS